MIGFYVREPHATRIINGQKKYEFRDSKSKKLGIPILLLTKKKALGIIQIDRILQIDKEYKFAWRITVIEKFKTPKPYHHPIGAVSWIKEVQFLAKRGHL